MTGDRPAPQPTIRRSRVIALWFAVVSTVAAIVFALLYGHVAPPVRNAAVGGAASLTGTVLWLVLRDAVRRLESLRDVQPDH